MPDKKNLGDLLDEYCAGDEEEISFLKKAGVTNDNKDYYFATKRCDISSSGFVVLITPKKYFDKHRHMLDIYLANFLNIPMWYEEEMESQFDVMPSDRGDLLTEDEVIEELTRYGLDHNRRLLLK